MILTVVTLCIAALLVIIDQVTKLIIVKNLDIGEIKEVIAFGSQKIFSITHVRNTGAAWSIMKGQKIFLIGFPVLVIGIMLFMLFSHKIKTKFEHTCVALVIAGGVGNLIDRIRLGEVVDFIKWEVFSFPVFNVADICIVVGAFALCIYYIIADPDKDKKKEAEKPENFAAETAAFADNKTEDE